MSRNNQIPLGCYLIMLPFALVFFGISTCNDKIRENENQEKYKKLQQEKSNYLNKFNLSFEEIAEDIKNSNVQIIQKSSPKKPIIIFQKRTINKREEVFFNYDLNKKLEKGYESFKNNEINTIVLVSDTLIKIGQYSRTEKIGFRNNIIITYIDKKTNRVIFKDEIQGEEPPEEIRYSKKDHYSNYNEVYGKRPSEEEIFEKIVYNIK